MLTQRASLELAPPHFLLHRFLCSSNPSSIALGVLVTTLQVVPHVRNVMTLATRSMWTQKMKVNHWHEQALPSSWEFQLRVIMGQQLSAEQKCFIRRVKRDKSKSTQGKYEDR
jgi:hypothetical protein